MIIEIDHIENCSCETYEFLILQGRSFQFIDELSCGTCLKQVSYAKLPLNIKIEDWQRKYQSVYLNWLESGLFEKEALKELKNYKNGKLNKAGAEIRKELETYFKMAYPYQDFLPELQTIIDHLKPVIGFAANNCLINYYPDGNSKMGYHSDQTDILEPGTGIAIVSVGATRTLKFRNINAPELFLTYELTAGSLVCMSQEIQKIWQHALPKSTTEQGRMSLAFRQMI